MDTASLTLDFIALLLAAVVIVSRVARYRRLRIDHVLLFTLGHAYYLSLSAIMVHTRWLNGSYAFVYRWFNDLSDGRVFMASLWRLLLLVAFLTGSTLGARGRAPVAASARSDRRAGGELAPAIVLVATVFAGFCLVAVVYRSIILQGYQSLDPKTIQEQAGRGVLSAAASATVISAIFLLDVVRRIGAPKRAYVPLILSAVAIAVPSAVLLISGGRMYVATAMLAALVWFSYVRRPLARGLVLAGGTVGFLGLVALGSLRTGSVPDRTTLGFYATSESALTNISAGRFLTSPREIFLPMRAPTYLLSDFSNVLPRAIFPAKDDLRADPEKDGFRQTSSLGAVQLTISALINFGYVGSLAVFGAFGYGLSRLRRRVVSDTPVIWSISYACLAATLMFSLYRDPFSISIVRWMFVNAVIVPAIYVLAVAVLRRSDAVRPLRRVTASQTAA